MRFIIPNDIIDFRGCNNVFVHPQTSSNVPLNFQLIEKHFDFYSDDKTKPASVIAFVQNTWNGLIQPSVPRPLTQAGVAHCQNEAWVVGAQPTLTGQSFSTMVGSALECTMQAVLKRFSAGSGSSLTAAVATAACCMGAELGAVELVLVAEPDRLFDAVFFEFGIAESIHESKALCNALQEKGILDAKLYVHQPSHVLRHLGALPPDALGLTYRQHAEVEFFFKSVLNNLPLT